MAFIKLSTRQRVIHYIHTMHHAWAFLSLLVHGCINMVHVAGFNLWGLIGLVSFGNR